MTWRIAGSVNVSQAGAGTTLGFDAQLNPVYIIPSVFNSDVVTEVAKAVREAANPE